MTDRIVICTDGACTKNGYKDALAGYGVYFGADDPRNISECVTGPIQTNNRAELQAFLYALTHVYTELKLSIDLNHDITPFEIITDSTYCMKGFTKWLDGWVDRGWVTGTGKPVKNRDQWEQVLDIKTKLDELKNLNKLLVISWIKGHSGHPGNEAADQLATNGLKKHARYQPVVKPTKRKRTRKKVPILVSIGTQTD